MSEGLIGDGPGQVPTNAQLGILAYLNSVPRSRVARTGNFQWTVQDCGRLIDYTSGTFTQTTDTAANLGPDWWVRLRNTGTGVVTLPTIDGVAGGPLYPGDCIDVICDGSALYGTRLGSGSQYLYVREEQASATNGGTSVSGYQTRVLNTTVLNSIVGASLASNLVTLPAGLYNFSASAPAYNTPAGHRLDLFNVTDGVNIQLGATDYCSTANTNSRANLTGQFRLLATKTVKLNHYHTLAQTSIGLGQAMGQSGVVEIYSTLQVWRV